METQNPIVDRQVIIDLLYGDEEYISEFSVASIESFSDFKTQFEKSLKQRDMENLKRAGHKIKPVAQMMKLDTIITMYETSKILLEEEANDESINKMISKMNDYCTQLINELKQLQ